MTFRTGDGFQRFRCMTICVDEGDDNEGLCGDQWKLQ